MSLEKSDWRRRGLALLGLVLLLTVFIVALGGSGLEAGLSHDDLMNLSWADLRGGPGLIWDNVAFFRPSLYPRPLGEFFYLGLFRAFDLEPLPYRIACYGLLTVNAGLLFWLALLLTGSRITAALASLLHAYHPNFWAIYFNTGTVFDLLCCLFSLACLIVYYRRRARGLPLRVRDIAALLALFIAALNSKELALALPAVLALDEAFHLARRSTGSSGLRGWALGLAALAAVGAVWLGGRLFAAGGLTENAAYAVDLSFEAYGAYLVRTFQDVFYLYGKLSNLGAVALLAAAGLIATLLRERAALVGWLLFAVGSLPVAFIPPRALSASYLPAAGIALWIATVVPGMLSRVWPGRSRTTARAALAAALLTAVVAVHVDRRRGMPFEQVMALEANEIRFVQEQLESLLPNAAPGQRALFLEDPFFKTERPDMKFWATVFLFELLYDGVKVDRAETLDQPPDPAAYDYVFTADGLKVERLK